MLTVARAYIRSAASIRSDEEIEEVGRRAYEVAGDAARELVEIREPGVEIDVREGTLSIVAVVVTTAVGLYVTITAYDSFWSGVERLRQHAILVADFIRRRFTADPVASSAPILSTRVSAGHLDKLHRLRTEVTTRRRTPDNAVQEALRTLCAAGEQPNESVILELERALGAPRRGTERVQSLMEHLREHREAQRGGGGIRVYREPPPPKPRQRHLTISRPPGAAEPTIRLDK